MRTQLLRGLKARPVSISLTLICILIVAAGAWTLGSMHAQKDAPQIQNMTQSLQVVNLERNSSGDAYVLTLKNGSRKNINGYSLGIGSASKLDVDLTQAERVVAPSETTQKTIPLSHLSLTNDQNQSLNSIKILAVMFDDGSSDGDEQTIYLVSQRRLGAKIQLQRVSAILASAAVNTGNVSPSTIENLKAQISALSIEPSAGQSPLIKSGLKSVKEDLLLEIETLKQNKTDHQAGLRKIKEKVERRSLLKLPPSANM